MDRMKGKIKANERDERTRYLQRVLREGIYHAVEGREEEAEDIAAEIVLALTGKKCELAED